MKYSVKKKKKQSDIRYFEKRVYKIEKIRFLY